MFPKAGELSLKKGQIIALSGNTGGSGGPHLHFEIRNPSGESTNPLLHGLTINDKLKPEIKRISIYRRDQNSLHSAGNYPYTTISKWSDQIQKKKPKPVLKDGVAQQAEELLQKTDVSYYKIPIEYENKGNIIGNIKNKRYITKKKKM